jgi:adenylate kinase
MDKSIDSPDRLKPIYFIIGPPISGKTTQSEILARHIDCPVLSVAQIMSDHISKRTIIGRQASVNRKQKGTIEDEIINDAVKHHLKNNSKLQNCLVVDGFPRSIAQFNGLSEIFVDLGLKITNIFFLSVPEDILFNRYEKNTKAMTDNKYFIQKIKRQENSFSILFDEDSIKKHIIKIDGRGSISSVSSRIKEKVK